MTEQRKRKALTHRDFFKLCEELRNQREFLTDKRWNMVRTMEYLSERLKFNVPQHSLKEAMEETGVAWKVDRSTTTKNGMSADQKNRRTRIILKAILDLYQKLGERPDNALVEEYKTAAGHPPGQAILDLLHPSQTMEVQRQAGTASSGNGSTTTGKEAGTYHSDVAVCPQPKK